ncbi:MAG TPA: exosortase/archaeosortase family protein [Chthoniobacterales bacterium]|nr:exosortase/archaeosortase family protein [Chthoniobacterales bacterium]
MKTTLATPSYPAETAPRTAVLPLAASLVFLGTIWFFVIAHLRVGWTYNPQYNYGWSVPLLVAYLIWKRWGERPAPAGNPTIVPLLVCTAGAVTLLLLRFVAEANPDWRLLSWAMSSIAVAVSLAFVLQVGGWPWLRHFAFPILFFFVAVPWPVQLEQWIIQNLMRSVTAINVFFLSVAGIPALQHGNVIEVRSGLIGIEEACSGVRSLQATLMVSLFLGELYSFNIIRRMVLVIAGIALAFICNVIRTSILVWVGANRGLHSIESWHDPAGLTILLVCLFGLWLLSLIMSRGPTVLIDPPAAGTFDWSRRIPAMLLLGLALLLVVGEAGTRLWYRMNESEIASSRWTANWPQSAPDYQTVAIPAAARDMLRYDEGGGASWSGADTHRWMMYFFRWLPGQTAAIFVKIHRPDVCLPASGLTLNRDDGIHLLTVNGVKLPVRSYRFDDNGLPLHVFYCYWDARSSFDTVSTAVEEDWSAAGRIRAALNGRREIGAQMLELVVWGYQDDAEAKGALEKQLAAIVQAQS